jgi:D-alanyl-D-alanine carboxypeptidase
MTLKARAIGMTRSTFINASGLPEPDAWTSARDMALLARRLIADFPGYYHYFSEPRFTFRGQVIFNHDNVLKMYPGADGLKTGYTIASGHNLVTSAVRGGHRLIGVELGCASNAERDLHMVALLNAGFQQQGVPVEDRPAVTTVASRSRLGHFPGLIASAHAAEVDRHALHVRPVAHLHPASGSHWAVQVGSFGSAKAAQSAVRKAHGELDVGAIRVEKAVVHGRAVWRAQIVGLSEAEAAAACSTLAKHGRHCSLLRNEPRQMAEL